MSIDDALKLQYWKSLTNFRCNVQYEKQMNAVSKYDFIRYLAIEKYFHLLKNCNSRISISRTVVAEHFPKQNTDHQARKIRKWADFFLKTGRLPSHQQGCHVNSKSLIYDEDVARQCRVWLRSQPPERICGASFASWVKEELHTLLGLPVAIVIFEPTARRWMHFLGLSYGGFSKGLYHDGHERADVVKYREDFLDRMLKYKSRMVKYDGDEMNDQIEPESTARRLVLVTHDESCFGSDQDHTPIKPKGEGRSLMVSEFLCECHGPMKLSQMEQLENPNLPKETAVIIKPGKNSDGYWTNSNLAEQLEHRLIPIFKLLHPDCDALIMFDNSQNHKALPSDALNANALNLSDGGKNVKPQRDGWLEVDGERVCHRMQSASGIQKGVRTILKERGLWQNSYSLKHERQLLQHQPDFAEQKSWLAEIVLQHPGFIIDFYPKLRV